MTFNRLRPELLLHFILFLLAVSDEYKKQKLKEQTASNFLFLFLKREFTRLFNGTDGSCGVIIFEQAPTGRTAILLEADDGAGGPLHGNCLHYSDMECIQCMEVDSVDAEVFTLSRAHVTFEQQSLRPLPHCFAQLLMFSDHLLPVMHPSAPPPQFAPLILAPTHPPVQQRVVGTGIKLQTPLTTRA